MQRFKNTGSTQKFPSIHAAVFQYLQRPTPSDFGPNASHASRRGDEHLAPSSRSRLKSRYKPASRRRFDNVMVWTAPARRLAQ